MAILYPHPIGVAVLERVGPVVHFTFFAIELFGGLEWVVWPAWWETHIDKASLEPQTGLHPLGL